MAGDWIPMRTDLLEDPAVIQIAAALGLDEYAVAGRLLRLWSWANHHTTDGYAAGVTPDWIDRYISTPKFASAMLDAGWLRLRSGAVEFPNFERWNSSGAKKRVMTSRRMRRFRGDRGDARGDASGSAPSDAPSVTSASPEKRREEKKDTPPAPRKRGDRAPPFVPPTVEEVAAYCRERGNGVDPQLFVDHYTANGWRVGRNPMRDWKCSVRTWEKNEFNRNGAGKPSAAEAEQRRAAEAEQRRQWEAKERQVREEREQERELF